MNDSHWKVKEEEGRVEEEEENDGEVEGYSMGE